MTARPLPRLTRRLARLGILVVVHGVEREGFGVVAGREHGGNNIGSYRRWAITASGTAPAVALPQGPLGR
ncbi:MAG: hypothetical protein ACRDQD_27960 [Nocardioidaceae bacterium]